MRFPQALMCVLVSTFTGAAAYAQEARMTAWKGYAVVTDDKSSMSDRVCPAEMRPVDLSLFLYGDFSVEVTDEFRYAAQSKVRLRRGTSLDGGLGDNVAGLKARSRQYSLSVRYALDGKRHIGSMKGCLAEFGFIVRSGNLYLEVAAVNYSLKLNTTIQNLKDAEDASLVFNYQTDIMSAGTLHRERSILEILRGDTTREKKLLDAADYPQTPTIGTLILRTSTPGWSFSPLKAGERPIEGALDLKFRFVLHPAASTN